MIKLISSVIFMSIITTSIAFATDVNSILADNKNSANAWDSIYRDCNRPNYTGFCDTSVVIETDFNRKGICWIHINSHQKEWQFCPSDGSAYSVRRPNFSLSVGTGPVRETSPITNN